MFMVMQTATPFAKQILALILTVISPIHQLNTTAYPAPDCEPGMNGVSLTYEDQQYDWQKLSLFYF